MGQVCAKHNEYFETECRWCEPVMLGEMSRHVVSLTEAASAAPRWWSGCVTIPVLPPPLPWPATLDFIPPAFRFVDAKTGKPVPLVGKHFPAPNRDACALCGMSGMQILQDPTSDCDPNDGHGAFE